MRFSTLMTVSLTQIIFFVIVDVSGYGISKREITYTEVMCPTDKPEGTTPYLEQLFIGRCWEFQYLRSTSATCPGVSVDCDDAWSKFTGAFVGQDPCNIVDGAFDELLTAVPIQFPDDTTLFWSGTNELAHSYADANPGAAFTLEHSMLGFMLNELNWCSSNSTQGAQFSSDRCPDFDPETCPNTATGVYWSSASTSLAQQTSGVATVMLNGSSPWDAFHNGSFFAKYELPNLDPEKVTKLRIIVAHDVGGPINEECGTGTVKLLEDLVDARGLPWTCEETPRSVRLLQCVPNSDHEDCQDGDSGGANLVYSNFTLFVVLIQITLSLK